MYYIDSHMTQAGSTTWIINIVYGDAGIAAQWPYNDKFEY